MINIFEFSVIVGGMVDHFVVYAACVVDEPPEKRTEDLRDERLFLVSWSLIEMFVSELVVDGKEWRADDQTCED